uniref:Uncharacterized protein n=2 Tax=Meloidogyne TaxID=189290 RepID=A0A914NUW1_MELIC
MSRRTSTTTSNSQDGEPQARRQRMDIVNNDNNSVGLDIEGIIRAERARATAVVLPAAALQIPNLDPTTFYTSSNYLFCGWRANHLLDSLTGRVTYSHRGPTMRRAFDRADLLLEVGSTNDLQTIGIFGYDGCAQILEPARQNNIIRLSMLTVVEQTGARNNWTGSLPYVLRFSRSSTMQIIGNAMPTPLQDANGNNSGIISNNNNFGIAANNNLGNAMPNLNESGGAGLPVIGSSSRGNQLVMNEVSGNPGTSASSRGGRANRNVNPSVGARGSSQGM